MSSQRSNVFAKPQSAHGVTSDSGTSPVQYLHQPILFVPNSLVVFGSIVTSDLVHLESCCSVFNRPKAHALGCRWCLRLLCKSSAYPRLQHRVWFPLLLVLRSAGAAIMRSGHRLQQGRGDNVTHDLWKARGPSENTAVGVAACLQLARPVLNAWLAVVRRGTACSLFLFKTRKRRRHGGEFQRRVHDLCAPVVLGRCAAATCGVSSWLLPQQRYRGSCSC